MNYICKRFFCASEAHPETRLEILDGFRGILAISVVLQHTSKIFKMTGEYGILKSLGTSFGVPSFFVLSSFLLTNKLYELMNKSNGKFNEIKRIIVKYMIRRFFRIYIPFLLLCTLKSFRLVFTKTYGYSYASWYNLVTLKQTGANHLWTVPPEVKYYLFIPIFTFITYKIQRYFFIWISTIIIIIFSIEAFNIFGLKCWVIPWPRGQNLQYVFPLFFNGSLLGLIYYKLQNTSYEFMRLKRLKFLLSFISPIIFLYGLKISSRFFFKNPLCDFKYSVYWAFVIFALLLEERDSFTEIINLPIFKIFGKYSFGVYLLHYEGFQIVQYLKNNNIMNQSFMEIIVLELFISLLYGILFYYLIENPSMIFGNYLIKTIYYLENNQLLGAENGINSPKKESYFESIITNILFSVYFSLITFFLLRLK